MPVALRGTVNSSFRLGAGTVSSPSLAFGNATSTGIFLQNGNIGFSVSGIEKLRLTSDGLMVTGNIIASNYSGNGSSLSGLPDNTFVSNIQVANSTYVALDDSSVDTNGGYIVCNGSGFLGGSMVLVDGTPVPATSVLSYTQLGAQVPSKAAGTYSVSVVRPDSVSISVPLGITYSPFPAWSTSTTLANVIKTIAFTQTLAATEATGANTTLDRLKPCHVRHLRLDLGFTSPTSFPIEWVVHADGHATRWKNCHRSLGCDVQPFSSVEHIVTTF